MKYTSIFLFLLVCLFYSCEKEQMIIEYQQAQDTCEAHHQEEICKELPDARFALTNENAIMCFSGESSYNLMCFGFEVAELTSWPTSEEGQPFLPRPYENVEDCISFALQPDVVTVLKSIQSVYVTASKKYCPYEYMPVVDQVDELIMQYELDVK